MVTTTHTYSTRRPFLISPRRTRAQARLLSTDEPLILHSRLTLPASCAIVAKDLSVQAVHRKLFPCQERARKAVCKQLLSAAPHCLQQGGVVHGEYIFQSPNPQQHFMIHGNPSNQQRGRAEFLPSARLSVFFP